MLCTTALPGFYIFEVLDCCSQLKHPCFVRMQLLLLIRDIDQACLWFLPPAVLISGSLLQV